MMKYLILILLLLFIIIPFSYLIPRSIRFKRGNDDKYGLDNIKQETNRLNGKTIIFLGSSVTYGAASKGISFVEYLEKADGIIPIKEALSGTTLVDEKVKGKASYIERLKTIDTNIKADGFVCQLSTNDATMKKPLGVVSDSFELNDFDTKTIAGAIEYIIAYARNTFKCPVIFYTNTRYNSDYYQKMVDLLYLIKDKWNIEIIDLWNDESMNNISKQEYNLYMVDKIHPSRAGYLLWWTPVFEDRLKEII